jgi:hypothetical protein
MRAFVTVVVVLAGLGFLSFGLAFVFAPGATIAGAGLHLEGTGALVELRAFYGGLELGLGLWFLVAATRASLRRPALWLALATNGGIGGARAIALLAGGAWTPFFGYALPWELGLAALAAIALRFPEPR